SNFFHRRVHFTKRGGIETAMVGLLNAPRLSKLYIRLKNEGRILDDCTGDNTNYSMNFIPMMDKNELLLGYQQIIHDIYSSKSYDERVRVYLKQYTPPFRQRKGINFDEFKALLKSVVFLGIINRGRKYYWKLLAWSLWNRPRLIPLAITYSIYGYHFRKVFRNLS
ncbi:MAG TPA: B12-binding domain-containing radical SAM protein, partial [Marinilabiliales bacterium]|nr:B12-binding domain-containing radical SAM protein [Marinilabiliales bacterium]